MMRLRMGWCTRDWSGGANYGPYSLKEARRIVSTTRDLDDWDRQALTYSIILSSKDNLVATEWTVDFNRLKIRKYHSDIRQRVYDSWRKAGVEFDAKGRPVHS